MNETEKLQKAVTLTVAAGYQLDKEAFDLLSAAAATEDPTQIISKAIQKIETGKEKLLFINRSLLEDLIKKPESTKENFIQPLENAT